MGSWGSPQHIFKAFTPMKAIILPFELVELSNGYGVMEYWSSGVLDSEQRRFSVPCITPALQYSNTPLLQVLQINIHFGSDFESSILLVRDLYFF
jgi:hypothetical protein